jgi:plasmid replication initiation protein
MADDFEILSSQSERKVSMSNSLARSAQGLSLSEKRIVALALSNENSKSPSKLAESTTPLGWKAKIRAHDYAEAFGIDPNTAYDQLKLASEKLFERIVTYEDKTANGKPRTNKFRWVSLAQYTVGDGLIELNFTPEIAPHLLGLSAKFTTYKLKHAASFESIYAWRLFEVLSSWRSTGLYKTSIEDFWETMEAPPSCRKDFKSLRVRVIEPSVKAIEQHGGLIVEWIPQRSGARRVTALEFRFRPNPQGRLDLEPAEAPSPAMGSDIEISRLTSP